MAKPLSDSEKLLRALNRIARAVERQNELIEDSQDDETESNKALMEEYHIKRWEEEI